MTVKVGDKVRIVGNTCGSLNNIGDVGVVIDVGTVNCRVQVEGNPNFGNQSCFSDVELVEPDPTPISTQCRDRMEQHMSKGEYVRAVKWAQIAELVEELEDEE